MIWFELGILASVFLLTLRCTYQTRRMDTFVREHVNAMEDLVDELKEMEAESHARMEKLLAEKSAGKCDVCRTLEGMK